MAGAEFANHLNRMWERACSRWRRNRQCKGRLTHRYREQARSHRGSWRTPPEPVGAGLAREGVVHPVQMQADPPLSRASPLPQSLSPHTDSFQPLLQA
ncbi:hypothetical protein FGE05_01035 [Pseudomonas sp. ICMP22404]|nr:hypothetical protein FGE05_01035 [Pseudomonas sp. ICMP22404]